MSDKIKILLLEDSEKDIKEFKSAISKKHFEITSIATSLKEAITLYNSLDFDIVLIDIFIDGEPDGIHLANQINNFIKQRPFIFITSSLDKNIFDQAKLTQPYHYLIKPYNKLELQFAMELAIEKFASKEGALVQNKPVTINDHFYIKKKERLVKVAKENIIYAKVNSTNCELITSNTKHLLNTTLNNLKKELPESLFIQTHRNYMVNSKKIKSVYPNDNLIVLANDEKIILSRRYKTNFLKTHTII